MCPKMRCHLSHECVGATAAKTGVDVAEVGGDGVGVGVVEDVTDGGDEAVGAGGCATGTGVVGNAIGVDRMAARVILTW